MASDGRATRLMTVTAADGRFLHVEIAGDGHRVVVVHVGSPCAGTLFDGWVRDAAARGLTLVSYDRPGYRGSAPQPGRSVADAAGDLRSISEAVGFPRCAVWGFSGGGPHALACAALLDGLVSAVATIGSPAPTDADRLDYFAGMREAVRQDIELFESDRDEWMRAGVRQRVAWLDVCADEFVEQWSATAAPADAAVLRGDFGVWLYRSVQAALGPGLDGWLGDDIAIFHAPWGFDPAATAVPVKLWHGGEDQFVPMAHGRWLARAIPGAAAEFRDEDGHLNVVAERIHEVHEWLAQYV